MTITNLSKTNNKALIFFICFFCCFFLLCQVEGQETSWRFKDFDLKTRWTDKVDPMSPLPEYPRPQMVRPNWQNLNGLWEYQIASIDSNMPNTFLDQILVPYPVESALSGVKRSLKVDEAIWYKKDINIARLSSDERVLLHFGAVDWKADVYLNGKHLGSHEGGYTNFSFDITEALQPGSNRLIVKVEDPTDKGIAPHGKQVLDPGNIFYTSTSGIWQTVWLETVNSSYISDLKVTPLLDDSSVAIDVNAPPNTSIHAQVIVDGNIKAEADGKPGNPITVKIPEVRLWSPDDPFLYDLCLILTSGRDTVDKIYSYFGMRKISISKDSRGVSRIFLNNRYMYNLGVLDQGYWPDGIYTAATDDALKFDLQAMKSMGFNTVRKHIKIEPLRWYYHADRIGMLVWQDFVNPNQALPIGAKSAFERDIEQTIKQLYNSPSIVAWVLFNEKWGQYDQERISLKVKSMDPSRLLNSHSGELLYVDDHLRSESPNAYVGSQMVDVHSYPYPRKPPVIGNTAQVIGEFGGFAVSVNGHIWDDMETGWGYNGLKNISEFRLEYKYVTDSLLKLERSGLTASILTQAVDVETEVNGLLTYDRCVTKIAVDSLRAYNESILRTKPFVIPSDTFMHFSSETESLSSLLVKYDSGRCDSASLRSLSLKLLETGDTSLYKKVSKSYLSSILDPFASVNIKYLRRFTRSIGDTCFKFVCDHFEALRSTQGGIGAIEQAQALISGSFRPAVLDTNISLNLENLQREQLYKFGSIAKLPVLQGFALHNYLKSNISAFIATKEQIHAQYSGSISLFDMNNDAWLVFQKSQDAEELRIALKWSKKVIDSEATGNYYDTYANILYKLGRKHEAIKLEEQALALPTGNGSLEDIKAALAKMKEGRPTWR